MRPITVLLPLALAAAAAEERPRVGVLFWHDSPNDRTAFEGVREGFSLAGIDPVFEVVEARGDDAAARAALRDFEARRLDVIFAMGTGAALRARDEVRERPVVFAAVTDPVGSGVVARAEGSGRNLCGASSGVDAAGALKVFRRAVPGLKRLAVVHDPDNPVSRREVEVFRAAGAALDPPLELEVRAVPAEGLRRDGGVRAACEAALERAEALWIPIDIEVYSRADQAAEAAAAAHLPVFTTAPAAARTAASVCVAPDFRAVGRSSVVLAVRTLRGADPGSMPVRSPRSWVTILNLEAAARSGFEIPLGLLAAADEFAGVAGGEVNVAAPARSRPGLRTLGALAVAAALAAGAGLVWFVHAPWLRARMREDADRMVSDALGAVARARVEDLDRTGEVLRAGTDHLVDRWGRDVEDLPFELVAGDPEAARRLVAREAAEVGAAARDVSRVLAAEVRRRSEERMAALEGSLREIQSRAGEDTASSLALGSTLLLLSLLAGLLGVQALLLGRAVVRPVRRIAEGAERLGSGDLAARVEEGGSREVADLAAGLNRMAAALERTRSDLDALNRDLERRVEEKSRALVRAETLASLGTLAGGVAHEFNNLLGGILGTAEDALQDAKEPAVREALELVERTARRGCNVTENLLRFARPRPPRTESVDAAALLRDAAGLFRGEAERRGVALEVREGGPPPFPADPAELHQVVLNLLSNALAFAPRGGRVTAEAAAEGDRAVIRVRDTGPGIPPDVLPRIFEPFFTTRGSEGTGLGLAVSHGIVRAHGGTLEAANDPAGGAVFTVRLPGAGAKGGGS